MTNTSNVKRELLENFILKGARKSELYDYYKPHSREAIKTEILLVLIQERNVDEPTAKHIKTLKGSEVAILETRLG